MGRKKDRFAHSAQSGKSVFCCGTNPIEGVREPQGERSVPLGGPGAQPRHAFGSFRRETKGTPGVGRAGPLVGAGATSPIKAPGVGGAPAPSPQQAHTQHREAGSWSPHETNARIGCGIMPPRNGCRLSLEEGVDKKDTHHTRAPGQIKRRTRTRIASRLSPIRSYLSNQMPSPREKN